MTGTAIGFIVTTAILAISVAVYFGVSAARANRPRSLTDFFLTDVPISDREVVTTLAATNTALALIVFWFSWLGWFFGAGAAIWLTLFWIVGLEVYGFWARSWEDYPTVEPDRTYPLIQTLHEYVSGVSAKRARAVLAGASAVTFLLMMTVELTRGVRVLGVLSPAPHSWWMDAAALLLFLGAAVYAAWGGLVAVLRTDAVQWLLTAIAVAIAGVLAVDGIAGAPGLWGPNYLRSEFSVDHLLLRGYGGYFILGSLFSWGIWFVVTMDMWQRAAAARRVQLITPRTRLVLYPWFAVLTGVSVAIGLYVRVNSAPSENQLFPAVTFMEMTFAGLSEHWWGVLLAALVFAGFLSAMVSTLDTYFVSVTHALSRDIVWSNPSHDWREAPRRPMIGFLGVGVGLAVYPLYIALAHSQLSINGLLYLATSAPAVLLPAVIAGAGNHMVKSKALTASVLVGFSGLVVAIAVALSQVRAAELAGDLATAGKWYNLLYLAPMMGAVCAGVGYALVAVVSESEGKMFESPSESEPPPAPELAAAETPGGDV